MKEDADCVSYVNNKFANHVFDRKQTGYYQEDTGADILASEDT